MEELHKSISLRPRFSAKSDKSVETLIRRTETLKQELKNRYIFVISGRQIWVYFHRNQQKYYSPHLQLEFQSKEDSTHISGLFGPAPALWTFFMFLHFAVATTFIVFMIAAYSHHLLKESFSFDIIMMGMMVVVWFALYFSARIIRNRGTSQMYELNDVFNKIIE